MTNLTNLPSQVGSGYTVEGQKTGQEKFGGLQIEIVPSYQTKLRTWQLAPTKQDRRVVSFDYSKSLDEEKTPSELGLEVGVKIRLYPSHPTYRAPCQISDLTGTAPSKDTHVKVGLHYLGSTAANLNGRPGTEKSGAIATRASRANMMTSCQIAILL
jgi:hypothetical protein